MTQTPASRWADAIAEAVREGDIPSAVDAARDLWTVHFVTDPGCVRAVLAVLPDEIWQNDAWLVTAMACSYWRSSAATERATAAIYFKEAARILADRELPDLDDSLAVELCEIAYRRSNGRFDESAEGLERIESGLRESSETALEVRLAFEARIQLQWAQLEWQSGRLDTGRSRIEAVIALDRYLFDHERATAYGTAALYSVTSESSDRVGHWADRAAEIADRYVGGASLWDTPAMAPALAALGLAAIERGDLDEAAAVVGRLERAAHGSEWRAWASQIETTRLLLDRRADQALETMRVTRAMMHGWTGAVLLESFAATARTGVEIALGLTHDHDLPVVELPSDSRHTICPGQYNGWLLMSEGRYSEAIASVAECIRLGDAHSRASLTDALLIDAAAHYAGGDPARGSASVDYALRLCAESGFRRAFFLLPSSLLRPMLQNASAHPQPEAVVALIAELERRFDAGAGSVPQLSARELEILAALGKGLTQREVAAGMFISHNTLKTHVRNIYRKLEVSSQREALTTAAHLGLTPPSPVA